MDFPDGLCIGSSTALLENSSCIECSTEYIRGLTEYWKDLEESREVPSLGGGGGGKIWTTSWNNWNFKHQLLKNDIRAALEFSLMIYVLH